MNTIGKPALIERNETYHLINKVRNTDTMFNVNDDKNKMLINGNVNTRLRHFFGKMVKNIFNRVTLNEVKETQGHHSVLKLNVLQRSHPSVCFSYFSAASGIRQYLPYIIYVAAIVIGAGIGVALDYYIFKHNHLNMMTAFDSVMGGILGTAFGACFHWCMIYC